jgi:hypothetical protein
LTGMRLFGFSRRRLEKSMAWGKGGRAIPGWGILASVV